MGWILIVLEWFPWEVLPTVLECLIKEESAKRKKLNGFGLI